MEPADIVACVQQWGRHSLAYSTLQPGMEYFGTADTGIVAWRLSLGMAVVLGDPLCNPGDTAALLAAFVAVHPRSVFMQVSHATATILQRCGYRATPVGYENEIDVNGFTLAGKYKRDLRHYRNRAMAAALTVREETDCLALRQALRPVSDSWLPLKSWHARELEFLARPFALTPEPGVRIFTASRADSIEGFVILDPMYNEGAITGYVVSILRHRHGAPEGTVDYINFHVIDRLRDEGIPLLSLGVSPFDQMPALIRQHGMGLPTAYFAFGLMRQFGDPIYHFRGLSFHKSRYRARAVPVFACMRPPIGAWPLIASAHASRMI